MEQEDHRDRREHQDHRLAHQEVVRVQVEALRDLQAEAQDLLAEVLTLAIQEVQEEDK